MSRKTYYEDCPNCGRVTTTVLYGALKAIENKLTNLRARFDNKEIMCHTCGAVLSLTEKRRKNE